MRALCCIALLSLVAFNNANSSEDVELKDPYLLQIAEFAASKLLEVPDFELGNVSLHRIMDAQFAAQAAPAPSLYLLTLELGADCSDGNCKSDAFHICEVTVMDEPWVKRRNVVDDKSRCALREPGGPLKFLGDSVATSVPTDGTEIQNLVPNTISQMETKTGGKHTLRQIEKARKVMMQETKSILYYLTLNISTAGDNSNANEICEVTMEEMLEEKEKILRSLHCFTTGDEDEPEQIATRTHQEELAPDVVRNAVLASLAVIDAESLSKFQLKVIGYSVIDSQVSVDSGTRDIRLKIGLVPSLCIKRPESNDEEEAVIKSCPVDSERDPSLCSITLTQWPWVTDGYLFSDLSCDLTNHTIIADTLEPYTDESTQTGESGLEVEEVNSNTVQASNRESTDDDEEEVEEEVFVARRAPCLGCPKEVDENSEEIKNLALSSLATLEATSNSEQAQALVRVVKATLQVVSGIKYQLTVELADTNCKQSENLDRSQCSVDNDGEQRTCTVSIWDQPWINSRKFLDPTCQTSSSAGARALMRSPAGGNVRISPNDDDVKEMAVFALDHLDSFDDNKMKRILVKVLDASYQIVAGKRYNLKVQMALSDCPETSDSGDAACQFKNSFPVYICDVSVLSQPWTETPKRLVESQCSPAVAASGVKETRDAEFEQAAALQSPENPPFPLGILPPIAVGGISPANTQNQYIKEIAKFATVAINENFNEANSVKLVRVVDAKTQIVDGTNVFLDVEVGLTQCSKGDTGDHCAVDQSRPSTICHVTVWDREYLNDRRVTNVSCDPFGSATDLTEEGMTTTGPSTDIPENDSKESNTEQAKMPIELPFLEATSKATPEVTENTSKAFMPLLGGIEQVDPLADEIQSYSDFALDVIQGESNSDSKLTIVKILASSLQITGGKNIRLTLEIGETDCSKNELTTCILSEAKPRQICNIQIWDRPWLGEKQVTGLNCQPKIVRRLPKAISSEDIDESPFVGEAPKVFRIGDVAGESVPLDPKSPELGKYIKLALKSIDAQSNNGKTVQLVQVLSADSQIAPEKLVKLKLEVGYNCADGTTGECVTNEREVCSATVLVQARLGKQQVNDLSCKSTAPTVEDSVTTQESVPKPDVIVTTPESPPQPENVAGGYSPGDPKRPDVQEMAEFATQFLSQSSNFGSLKLITIKSVRIQIVSGVNYQLVILVGGSDELRFCNVTVYNQAWTETRYVTSWSCAEPIGIPGGYSKTDPDSPRVQEMAMFATAALGKAANSELKLVKVRSAKVQSVAGENYNLVLELTDSTGTQICEVVVFDQAWTGMRELSSSSCSSSSKRTRQITGSYSNVDVSNPAVQEMASFATNALGESSNSKMELVKVRSAQIQIVSGKNYKMSLELNTPEGTRICQVVVYDQKWTNTRKLTSSSCSPPPATRVGRRITGGYSPISSDDPEVKEIASFAVSTLSEASNARMSLLKIHSAKVQIVAGKNYQLSLEIDTADGTQICQVTVFDQSWTNTRNVSASSCSSKPSVQVIPKIRGGYTSVRVDSTEVTEIASFATSALSQSSNSQLTLLKVKSAAVQIVAGKNYKLALELDSPDGKQACLVVVFDQAWTQTRELTNFTCSLLSAIKVKRQVPGGFTIANVRDPDVLEMAAFATQTLAASSNSKFELIRVTKASTQVVAGTNYDLTLELNTPNGKQICQVRVFDQSWTNTRALTKSSCSRSLRPRSLPPIVGGYSPVDPDDDEIQKMASFAVDTLTEKSNAGPLTIVKINSAAVQIVSGKNYKINFDLRGSEGIQTCEVVVYDQPWTNTRELSESSCSLLTSTKQLTRSKRSETLVGGPSAIDIDSPKVQELQHFATNMLNQRLNERNAVKITRVVEASQQIVSGVKYTLKLEIGFTNCPKDTVDRSCKLDQQRGSETCTIVIWERPWLNSQEVLNISCDNMKTTRSVYSTAAKISPNRAALVKPGKIIVVDPNSTEIQQYTQTALNAVRSQSNSDKLLNVIRIKKAGMQSVSGKMIYLTFEVGQTICNRDIVDNSDCPFDKKLKRQTCNVKIWNRVWLNQTQILDLSCRPGSCNSKYCSLRSKREFYTKIKKPSKLKYMTAFRSFMVKYEKVYTTWAEFDRRYKIYRENQRKIQYLRKTEMGTADYGDTPFSDLTEEEFRHFTGLKPDLRRLENRLLKAEIPNVSLPAEYDWRHYNAVTPVKNQGMCGSCWAFSVTGNVEGQFAVKHGKLLSLSEQELVDCDQLDSGCNGGLPENAYKAIQDMGGLETESDYPYNAHKNRCNLNRNMTQVQVTGGVEISTNETQMAQWLVTNGPISIGINANAMQFYRGGISHPWKVLCNPNSLDHGVLIVGYGVSEYPKFKKTLPYWIIKNSWGTKWGEQGYYRIYRGDGTCGVNQMATSATVV